MKQWWFKVLCGVLISLQMVQAGEHHSRHVVVQVSSPDQQRVSPTDSPSWCSRNKNNIIAGAVTALIAVTTLAVGAYFLAKALIGEHSDSPISSAISCNFKFTGLHLQSGDASGGSGQRMHVLEESVAQLSTLVSMIGSLLVVNNNSGLRQNYDNWPVDINTSDWRVSSDKTIVLDPGIYDLTFLVGSSATEQYTGSTRIDTGSRSSLGVDMEIKPVIGDTILQNFSLIRVGLFLFKYVPGEIQQANISNPLLGLLLDEKKEAIFVLNRETGISDLYANIPEGGHSIYIKLYDGDLPRAQSEPSNKQRQIIAGQDLTFDLIPFYTMLVFNLSESGGSANFNFAIPAEIITTVGKNASLQVIFSLSGQKNGNRDYPVTIKVSNDTSKQYTAQVTVSKLHYEMLSWALAFYSMQVDPPEELGICGDTMAINAQSKALNCNLQIFAKALATGRILAVVGINVFLKAGPSKLVPVTGALITMDNDTSVLGRTGSHSEGSRGYIKLYLPGGNHVVKASKGGLSGVSSLRVAPLEVKNIDIVVDGKDSDQSDF